MSERDEAVCAIDIGTSAVRALLATADGRRLHVIALPHQRDVAATRFDPDGLWGTVAAAVRQLLGATEPAQVAGVAVTGHLGTVFLDDVGNPVGDGATWADARGVAALERLLLEHPDAAATTGRRRPSGSSLAAWLELLERAPADAQRVRAILSPKDFVLERLTGRSVVDPTTAAYSFAFDVAARAWSEVLITAGGARASAFPEVVDAGDVVGVASAAAADATGLRAGLPVVAGGPDGSVGVFGATGIRTGVVTDIAGTTDVLARCLAAWPGAAQTDVVVNPYVARGFWTVGGPTGSTGGAIDWIAALTGHVEAAAAAAAIPPGARGLLVSPHLSGSRFPFWHAGERFAIWGLDASHTAAEIVRATQEGAAFVVRAGLELMEPAGARLPLVLAGGTAKAARQAQLRADVLGRAVEVPSDADATLAGAAMLAAAGSGLHDTLEDAWSAMRSPVTAYAPDRERAEAYDELFVSWCAARRDLPGAKERE